MGKKLYVGNLPYTVTDNVLSEAFSQHGHVTSAKVIIDRDTQRSKGFGFVEMSTDNEAQEAIDSMNRSELDGRTINVTEARPMESGDNRQHSQGGRSKRW